MDNAVNVREEITPQGEFKKGCSRFMGQAAGSMVLTVVIVIIMILVLCFSCYVTSKMFPTNSTTTQTNTSYSN